MGQHRYRTPGCHADPPPTRYGAGGPDYRCRPYGDDDAYARRGDPQGCGSRHASANLGPPQRHGEADRRRRRSPSPNLAWHLSYDTQEPQRRLEWEPRMVPHLQPPHQVLEDPHPLRKMTKCGETNPPQAQAQRGVAAQWGVHICTPMRARPGAGANDPSLVAHHQQGPRSLQSTQAHTPHKSYAGGGTQTTPNLTPRTTEGNPTVSVPSASHGLRTEAHITLHVQRLPAGWTCQHLVDRFMWFEGAVGVAEAYSVGEMHGYLIFQTNREAVAACAIVSAALWTVAPRQG